MIRIDYYNLGENLVSTRWVQEKSDRSSLMGKLIFDSDEFEKLTILLSSGKLDSGLEVKFQQINIGDKNDINRTSKIYSRIL